MPTPKPSIALRPFLLQVEERLEALSPEALRALLLSHARYLSAQERPSFLALLSARSAPPKEERLLGEVEAFLARLKAGRYFREWSADEPSRALGDESWVAEMDALFSRAGLAFLQGDYDLAARTYGALLHAFRLEAEGNIFCGPASAQEMLSADLDEAKARYLRALYLSLPAKERPQRLLEELLSLATIGRWSVLLRDIEDTERAPLPERGTFFEGFEACLHAHPREGQNRLYPIEDLRRALLREATYENKGVAGIVALAKEEGAWHPELYHALLDLFLEKKDLESAFTAARDGMLHIEDPSERTLFADRAAALALEHQRSDFALAAQVQAFRATPTPARLLSLLAVIPEADVEAWATRELEEAKHRVLLPESVSTWLSLLRGDTKSALRALQSASSLGWSRPDHPGKVAFPALLIAGSGQAPPENTSLEALFGSVDDILPDPKEHLGRKKLLGALLQKALPKNERKSLLDGVIKLAEKRIRAIISHQHKKAFGRAAQLCVACAEAYYLAQTPREGEALLSALSEEFRRHAMFRDELEKKRASSSILQKTPPTRTQREE